MASDVVVKLEHVSKKFCKSLKRGMAYGITDLTRNLFGMRSKSEVLRKGEFWAVDDVSFELRRGETLGLLGPNGAGKTTLLQLINGIFWPDKGKITVRGRVGSLIAVGAGFHPQLTGRENIFVNAAILGMSRHEIGCKFDEIVEFAEIGDFLDTPVKHYSSGMYVRLGFAIAAHCDPDVLLVDEVLAVGDEGFQLKCLNKMGKIREAGAACVMVSHSMHLVGSFASRILLLAPHGHTIYEDVPQGVAAYSALFEPSQDDDIQRIATGTEHVRFSSIDIPRRDLVPNDDFEISMEIWSDRDYDDIEVDLVVFSNNAVGLYHQATNRAYGRRLDIRRGTQRLALVLKGIPLNGTGARVAVSIWSHGRSEKLFWWRIPVRFALAPYSSGRNHLQAEMVCSMTASSRPLSPAQRH